MANCDTKYMVILNQKILNHFKSKDVTHISLHDRGQVGEQQLAHQIDIDDSFLARRCCGVGW